MDFFANQEMARRKTGRLVLLFVLAVLAILVMVYLAVALTMGFLARDESGIHWESLLNLRLLGAVGVGTILLVGFGSLYKVAQLQAGGRVIAESLSGQLIDSGTTDPLERKVLNVVEEMSIASGTPTPPVYLLNHEQGINAFAAGYSPSDAVIGVTRGCVKRLTRDQLQGVIAHEFSHILNGDMRLNIRLIGVVHGILVIGLIGYFVLRSALYSGATRRRSSKENPLPLFALGAAFMAIGFLGMFFGNLIKAAVSRQREFLADAAAVQFTRNPHGIGSALMQIGGFATGSAIQNPNAPEVSHMFFGQAITSGINALFATHPPLADRITRIDPAWDGTWPEVNGAELPKGATEAVTGVAALAGAAAPTPVAAFSHIGQPTEAHVHYAVQLVQSLPEAIRHAAREPYGARAVIYTMLLDAKPEPRRIQLELLAEHADSGVYGQVEKLLAASAQVQTRARLPLIDLAIPTLRALSPDQYQSFKKNVEVLVKADRQIDLFEWSLQRILLHHLEAHYSGVTSRRTRYSTLNSLHAQCEVLLSALAYVGNDDHDEAHRAFDLAAEHINTRPLHLCPIDQCRLDTLDRALDMLDRLAPRLKRQVLMACTTCISADRQITTREAELLRAVCESLSCPMPPLLPGQKLI